MLNFTDSGLLTPREAIEVSRPIFYDQFVRAFSTSQTRARLFNEWINYNKLLRSEIGQDFFQWIDESFVTLKQNPKDIDLVSFIPHQLYERHHRVLDNLWTDNWEQKGIYPANHPAFDYETKRDWEQWMPLNRMITQHPKGFLTLQIQ